MPIVAFKREEPQILLMRAGKCTAICKHDKIVVVAWKMEDCSTFQATKNSMIRLTTELASFVLGRGTTPAPSFGCVVKLHHEKK